MQIYRCNAGIKSKSTFQVRADFVDLAFYKLNTQRDRSDSFRLCKFSTSNAASQSTHVHYGECRIYHDFSYENCLAATFDVSCLCRWPPPAFLEAHICLPYRQREEIHLPLNLIQPSMSHLSHAIDAARMRQLEEVVRSVFQTK